MHRRKQMTGISYFPIKIVLSFMQINSYLTGMRLEMERMGTG
jgi:hypothetical protein